MSAMKWIKERGIRIRIEIESKKSTIGGDSLDSNRISDSDKWNGETKIGLYLLKGMHPKYVYVIGHSPFGLFRSNVNKQ